MFWPLPHYSFSVRCCLKRKTELIEEKKVLIDRKIATNSDRIATVFRGGIFDVELGEGNIGGEKNKTRPAVVVTPDRMNKGNTVIIIPLSTKFSLGPNGRPLYRNHYLLRKADYPFLDTDSVIKTEDIRSVDVVRLRNLRGNLNREDMKRLKNSILFICGY